MPQCCTKNRVLLPVREFRGMRYGPFGHKSIDGGGRRPDTGQDEKRSKCEIEKAFHQEPPTMWQPLLRALAPSAALLKLVPARRTDLRSVHRLGHAVEHYNALPAESASVCVL